MKHLGLIAARENKGWNQNEAAKHLLISKSFYQKLELGLRKPGVHLALIMSELFGEDIYDVNSLKHSA